MPDDDSHSIKYSFAVVDAVVSVFMLITTICVGLRFFRRCMQRGVKIGWDDWTILAAFVFSFGLFISEILLSLPNIGAAGYNTAVLSASQRYASYVLPILITAFYGTSVAFSKSSVILFYCRIFSVKSGFLAFMRVLLILILLVWAVFIGLLGYNPSLTLPGVNLALFVILIINIIVDMIILAAVQFKTWQLQLTIRSKIGLSVIFSLGLLSIIASILRLFYTARLSLIYSSLSDLSSDAATIQIWAAVEMYLYIICACLPVLHGLIRSRSKDRPSWPLRPSQKSKEELLTVGRIATRPQWNMQAADSGQSLNGSLQGVGYNILCESADDNQAFGLKPLSPVQIQREWAVTWDAGEMGREI
ncbi:unnamed protein product [Discula destructiva]